MLGVNKGFSNLSLSLRPEGIWIPWTVPETLYSFHADPAINSKSRVSMAGGNSEYEWGKLEGEWITCSNAYDT